MRPDERSTAATWCDIDRDALRHNAKTLRRRLGAGAQRQLERRPRLGIVVKADAYGHGMDVVVKTLAPEVDWLIVNSADEAVAVRRLLPSAQATLPIYICGPLHTFQADAVVDAAARALVVDLDVVAAIAHASRAKGVVTPLHIKVETGTHRQGLKLADVVDLAAAIAKIEGVALEGVTTHYADIEDTTDHRFADGQRLALEAARGALRERGITVDVMHSANSAATILDARTHGDLVRAGIAAYGLWPSRETQAAWMEQRLRDRGTRPPVVVDEESSDGSDVAADDDDGIPMLKPVLSWRARLAQVKAVSAGAFVGYGRTYRATHASRIAIVPVGYHEGYDRRLSNVGHVLVDGVRCPVRGRVCMNMLMVDVTDVEGARSGSVATLLGSDGDETISAEQVASWMGSIHYEVVSRIHPSVPRFPLNE
jgi:alanine racemase